MNYDKISKIVDVPVSTLREKYEAWEKIKRQKKRKGDIVVDMKLLAAFSGLSVSSISNFFKNTSGLISQERTEMLELLVEEVGYIPSYAAKKLRSNRKMSIAFISSVTFGSSTEYLINVLKGVRKEAEHFSYFVDLYDIDDNQRDDFFSDLPFLGLIDGLIIVASVTTAQQLEPLVKRNIPVVLINPKIIENQAPITSTIFSDTEPFTELLDHLFGEHQYKNPMYVTVNLEESVQRREKYQRFLDAVEKYSIPFQQEKNCIFVSTHSFKEGDRAYTEALEKNPDADVFICLTDTLAIPILKRLEKDNRKAAVTGYANFEIAEIFDLTTIDQHIFDLGKTAFQHLYYAMQYVNSHAGMPEYREERVSGSFIHRTSCELKRQDPIT
jgi:LacI family transcriptional regulator, sucrose operon repressor